jgi:hypothetical protein
VPCAAAVSICSQGRNGPRFSTTTPHECHVTQRHHPACEPLLVGGDSGADDDGNQDNERQRQRLCQRTPTPTNIGDTNTGDDNAGTTMSARTTTQGQRTPGNKWGQPQHGDNHDTGTTTWGQQRCRDNKQQGGNDAPASTTTA